MNNIDGVEFNDAFIDRQTVDIEEMQIPVIAKKHLLINKKTTGRERDLNDVLWLERE